MEPAGTAYRRGAEPTIGPAVPIIKMRKSTSVFSLLRFDTPGTHENCILAWDGTYCRFRGTYNKDAESPHSAFVFFTWIRMEPSESAYWRGTEPVAGSAEPVTFWVKGLTICSFAST